MTRNIEINYLNSSGYDLLYPKTIDSNTEVDAIIKEILSLPESDMLDDVLLNMVLPDNKYAVALTVKTPGGRPFNGASVSGITSYVGEALTTDENGYVLGFCDTSTPTVTVTNPFLDVSGNVVQRLNLSGKVINTAEMKAVRGSITQITYDSGSRTIQFSPDVDEFDCSAVGGGEDGGDGDWEGGTPRGGKGGDAGEVSNSANNINNGQIIAVSVGGKGQNSEITGIITARGGYLAGGRGAIDPKNGSATQARAGADANASFLYPPRSVSGAGGGGAAAYMGSGVQERAGGDPGGGNGGNQNSNGKNGTTKGSGGGGGGCHYNGSSEDAFAYQGGSGQPGLVGFMWRYKSDLT